MATPYVGRGSGIGFVNETVWGTAVARSNWLPLADGGSDLMRKIDRRPVPELVHATAGDLANMYSAAETVEGGFEVIARYGGIGYLLGACLGAQPTTNGTASPYTHTFTLSATLPSLTLELIRGTSGNSEVFEGFKVSDFALSVSTGDLMRLRLNGMAQTGAARGAAGTPTYSTAERIAFHHAGTVSWNSGTYTLKSLELSGTNQLARVDELGTLQTAEPGVTNIREYRLKATLMARSDALYTAHLASTAADLSITFTGATSPNAMAIRLYNAEIVPYGDPISSFGYIEQTVEWVGKGDSSNGSLEIDITNATATATAN